MVYRVYTEKREGLEHEASSLLSEIRDGLGIKKPISVRVLNRYDVENISKELFEKSVANVFSEPTLDNVYYELPECDGAYIFAVEYLPGQFDQRADSASQCIQLISMLTRPTVASAKVYIIKGELDEGELERIKKHVINPVESRLASLELPKTLKASYDIPHSVDTLDGFITANDEELAAMVSKYSLAMDDDDVRFCRDYFLTEKRDPTISELRMIDTYWSDHCRHTTFLTTIDDAEIEDEDTRSAYDEYIRVRAELNRTKPVNLMDIATIGARYLKAKGKLPRLDESEEINACTVKIDADIDGKNEKWLFLFKNETHNHPTEIEPFGGAATCIGGAIRDPLSGRSYVYQAMRVTGAADPLLPIEKTMSGKLPQKKIVTTAAAGYSSYGNQIGLATGRVDEIYHPGYVAKRMEIGAVVGAAPEENVKRQRPEDGDIVVLLGGRTGRDGCGGATGSSKSHTLESLTHCGAEVQKGNAPEERKLQRLMRDPKAARMIKRCNDFGAGGVSVAIGELADGLEIDLDKVPKKYEGLDGTELAISESQERMAVVLAKEDVQSFIELANGENLEATVVARVTENPRLVMMWQGKRIVDVSRDFLNSNGAEKHTSVKVGKQSKYIKEKYTTLKEGLEHTLSDLNFASGRGLGEMFDSTIGAATVLMPYGGKYQRTPTQCMAAKLPVGNKNTNTGSVMAWGYDPYIMSEDRFKGAYYSVVQSLCKLACSGVELEGNTYFTYQEYFEKPKNDPSRWGKPFAALLGAFKAQLDYGIASIGGKDSMSGSFEDVDVPPTLVSFAVCCADMRDVISPEFKKVGSKVVLLKPEYKDELLPDSASLWENIKTLHRLAKQGKIISAYTPTRGGVADAIYKMCIGNGLGFEFSPEYNDDVFAPTLGQFVLEVTDDVTLGTLLGHTTEEYCIAKGDERVEISSLDKLYESKLESVYPCNIEYSDEKIEKLAYKATSYPSPAIKCSTPKFLIPVFPGTNCEYDTERAIVRAGGSVKTIVINNLTPKGVSDSVDAFAEEIKTSQVIFVPGGFSGGDEPDGSGKFITAFFRNPKIAAELNELLKNRDGLMAGICNGFQAIIKLGLVPFGEITEAKSDSPTLTFNTVHRHRSKIVRTVIASNKSPWLSKTKVGEVYSVPISHGEGRFICPPELYARLAANGQIATQYVDLSGEPTYDIAYNPNGSMWAVEGITSPDGRVFGKMGHSERYEDGLYRNVDGKYDIGMFESAVEYYKI